MAEMSKMVSGLKRSGIRVILDLASGMDGVIHLEIGQPLFNTPPHICEAGAEAARTGYTRYTPNKGLGSLREAIAERVNKDYRLSLSPDNVVVGVGGVGVLATSVRGLVDTGDEVLLPDPGWPNYEMIVYCAGAVPRRYPMEPDRGFLPSVESIEKAITPKTKAIILNSPSNPLGVVLPPELLEELVELARRRDLFILSDEVYEKILFEGRHACALSYDTDGRVISVFSFSKSYAMTGWRVGYAAASEKLIDQVGKLQEPYVSCACSVSQKAAEAALLSSQDCVEEMRQTYQDNLAAAKEILDRSGLRYFLPQGAFYMWIEVNTENSSVYARELLSAKKVAVAPGTTFGPSGRRYIRISLASAREEIREGLRRLADFDSK